MVALFAPAAMTLAVVGLYSLAILVVTVRTQEVGVRIRLGAAPGQIVRQVVFGVVRPLSIGIATGLLIAALANRLPQSRVFGVGLFERGYAGGRSLLLIAVPALAMLVPARRSAKIDPLEALRAE